MSRGRASPGRALAAGALAALAGCGGPSLLYEGRGDLTVEPIEVRLVRVTDRGLEPAGPVRLVAGEGGVAFLNDTRASVVSVVFPMTALPALRCSYTHGFETDGRATFTETPLEPGRVATLCAHAAGTLPFEIRSAGAEPLDGQLVVVAPERQKEGR